MMKKRVLALLLALSMALALAACGGNPGAETPAPSAPAASPSAPASTAPAPVESPASTAPAAGDITSWILEEDTGMSGTVRFWIPFKGEQGMNDMIAEFNQTYPNIKVELTTYSNNADGNLSVNAAIMSEEVDVLASFGLANTYLRWENVLYQDLTGLVAGDGISLTDNWGTDAYTYDGKIYTLPCGGISYYICVNMDAWNAAGLGDLPGEWTWDEYLAACEAMTQADAGGQVSVYGGSDSHSIECFTFPKYQVTGRDNYYDDATGLSSFGDPIILNSLKREIKAELEDKVWYPKSIYRADGTSGQDTYPSGKVASIVTNNMIRFLRDTENYPTDFVTGFAPYPVEEKGQTNYMAGVGYFSHAGITTGCQDQAAAEAFLKWYSTYGSKYLAVAGHQSTWKGTDTANIITMLFGSEDSAAAIVDVDSFKRVVGNTAAPGFIDTVNTANSEVASILKSYGLSALNGEMSPEDAMAAAQAEADAAIKDAQ